MDSIILRGVYYHPLCFFIPKTVIFPHFPQACKSLFPPQLKAKETEVMQEMEGQKFRNFVAYSLLSQRHLRQRVTLLQDCHRLRNAALKSQKEGTGLEYLGLEVKFSFFYFFFFFWFKIC